MKNILPLFTFLLIMLCTVARPDSLPPPVIPQCMGVNIHFTGAPAKDLEDLQDGGFGWVRMDFAWAAIEKVKGQYDFSAYDTLVAGLKAHGIKPLFILDYGNDLYQKGAPRSPEARAAFARFAVAAVRHYHGKPILWEIWNEPNIGFWEPKPNTAEYARLAFETAQAIKKADPNATVLAPGSSTIPLDFLEGVFRTGILRYLDAVSMHPYRGEMPETAARDYPAVRRLIRQYAPKGKVVPLVSSEWGYSTTDISEETQAQYLARQWLSNLAAGVRLSIWYDWHEDGVDPKYNEHHFGTVRYDYVPKPAFLAARRLTHALNGYRFVKRLPLGQDSDYLLLFAQGESVKLAYWTTAADHTLSLPTSHGARLTLTRSPQYWAADGDLALRAASAWTVHSADTFSAAGKMPTLILTYRNRDAQAHRVQFLTEMTTPDGRHALPQQRPAIVAAGQVKTWEGRLPNFSRVPIGVRERLVLDRVTQPYSQELAFEPMDPLGLSVAPLDTNHYQVEVTNPAGTAFAGRLSLVTSGGTVSLPVRILPGQKSSAVTLRKTSTPASVCLLRDAQGALVTRLPIPNFVPYAVALPSLTATLDGDLKVVSKVRVTPAVGPSPGGQALRVDYHFAPGWSFARVAPPQSARIPGQPVGMGLWIYGDSSGNAARMRFRDATGQTLQVNGLPINWYGWRFVSFYLVSSGPAADLGHWGGANDGRVHYPVQVNTLFLLDSLPGTGRHQGTIWVKSPQVIYAPGT